jgi:hypothetical protein
MEERMKKLIFAVAMTAMVSGAQAASYQAQGCGLGSTIWTDGSNLVHQVLGATTNGTSGNQTFGMTSGTSNCELDGAGHASVVFIEANRVALSNDIARGNGDTLASLVRMYGCSNVEAASTALQKNYETIFTNAASAQMIDSSISNVIASNKACI